MGNEIASKATALGGLAARVSEALGFRVSGFQGLGFKVLGFGFQGLGFKVLGSGLMGF